MLGYTSWLGCLFTVVIVAFFFYILVVIQLYFSYLFNMLFSYLLSAVYHIVICSYCFYARAPFLLHTHTHSLGRFWRPWICTSRVLVTLLYCSGVRVIVRVTRSWSFSFLDYRYSCSFIDVIFWFYLYRIQLLFSFFYSFVIIVLDI